MKSLVQNDTVQIEITNICPEYNCANCTRFCSLVSKPYFMDFDFFKKCVDSLECFPHMVGFQGGECLYHPKFSEMCEYARSKFSKDQLGLWTTFPKKFSHYRKIIVDTFGHIFLNSHERNDIMHHPFLVSSKEVLKEDYLVWNAVDNCSFQKNWSASLSPRGAFFYEMASSLSILFDQGKGWDIEKGWFWKTPKDYKEQIEKFCSLCGGCIPLKMRSSNEKMDDISIKNYLALKGKVRNPERLIVHDLETYQDKRPLASYKDERYRSMIAKTYGMFLIVNSKGFWTPYLYKSWNKK